jgi:hypothetical protein
MDIGLEVKFSKADKSTGKYLLQSLYLNFVSKEQRDAVYTKV